MIEAIVDLSSRVRADAPGVVALPDGDPADGVVLLGFSPTNFHTFLVAGDVELHPRLVWNRPFVRPARAGTVRAGLVVRFRGIERARVAKVADAWRVRPPARTATCLDGALARLDADFGIRLAVPPRGDAWLAPVFVSILGAGFDRDGEPVPFDIYGTLGLAEAALARAMARSDVAFRGRVRASRFLARCVAGKSRANPSGSAFHAFDLSRDAD